MRKPRGDLQGSLVALDHGLGEVRALVGGRDFGASSYIRCDAGRPPAWIRVLSRLSTPLRSSAAWSRRRCFPLDEPIMTDNGPWLPGGDHERTEYSLRAALKVSSNRAAAQLLQQVGYRQTTYYAQRLGIESRLPAVASLALGTGGVTLLELTSAYGVFANRGVAVSPHLIVRVEDAEGTPIWSVTPGGHQAVTSATRVFDEQHAGRRNQLGHRQRCACGGIQAAGGGQDGRPTTTPTRGSSVTAPLVTGVWFGLDKPAPIMNAGLHPSWRPRRGRFMKQATANDRPDCSLTPRTSKRSPCAGLSGQRATPNSAVMDGWVRLRAGRPHRLRGTPAGDVPVGTTGANPRRPCRPRTVYDDYFPIGTAPYENVRATARRTLGSAAPTRPRRDWRRGMVATAVSTTSSAGGHLEKMTAADGRSIWVVNEGRARAEGARQGDD